MNSWKFENLFYLTSHKSRLLKVTDHYEIYKKILNVKGDILEFGVFKGASLIRLLSFRDLMDTKFKRKVYGFDIFGRFPKPINKNKNYKADKIFASRHDKNIGLGIKKKLLENYLEKKNFKNFKLIKGNVIETLPVFLKKNKKLKVSLLHIDLDTYEPTKFVLTHIFNRMSKGAIILLDDYKHIKGATLAADEFLKKNKLKISKVSKNGRPYYIQLKK